MGRRRYHSQHHPLYYSGRFVAIRAAGRHHGHLRPAAGSPGRHQHTGHHRRGDGGDHPNVLWEPGFQLSFAATLGLVLYAAPLQTWFTNLLARRLPLDTARSIAAPVGNYFLFTLAAQVMTLPVIVYHFQRISLVASLTNPIVLPAQPSLMILGGLAVLLGMLWQPLGQLIACLAWPFIAFSIRAVEWFATLPGESFPLSRVSLVVVEKR